MSKQKKIPALPQQADADATAASDPIAAEFEIVTGPDMSQFNEHILSVLKTLSEKRTQLQHYLLKKQADMAYDLVEIGWVLLKAKAAVEHGQTGNQNAAKNQKRHVSHLSEGFEKWVSTTFAEINKRTAQRYMNAARNLKLSAESTLDEVRALREKKVLEDKRLKDLYLPPRGEAEETDPETDSTQAQRELKLQQFKDSFFHLEQLGIEQRIFLIMPKPQINDLRGRLKELDKALQEALAK